MLQGVGKGCGVAMLRCVAYYGVDPLPGLYRNGLDSATDQNIYTYINCAVYSERGFLNRVTLKYRVGEVGSGNTGMYSTQL